MATAQNCIKGGDAIYTHKASPVQGYVWAVNSYWKFQLWSSLIRKTKADIWNMSPARCPMDQISILKIEGFLPAVIWKY